MNVISLAAVLCLAVSAAACAADTTPGDEVSPQLLDVDGKKKGDQPAPAQPATPHAQVAPLANNPLYQPSGAGGTNPLYEN